MSQLIYDKNILPIISGWNEKLNMKNDELSKLVPFVELFAIYDDVLPSTVKDDRLKSEAISVNLKPLSGVIESVKIIPLFSMINQQTSTNAQGRLLYSRGIPGIENLIVSALNYDSNAMRVEMQISIPTLEKEIKINTALRTLLTLNSDWILMYGWAKESQGIPIFSEDNSSKLTIDLTASHKGYYKVAKITLVRYDWELSKDKMAFGTLNFASNAQTTLTVFDISHYRSNIQSFLNGKFAFKNTTTTNQLKDAQPVYKKINKVKHSSKNEIYTHTYYSLGWAIEAIRQSIPEDVRKNIDHIEFDSFNTPKSMNIFLDDTKKPINIVIKNVGYIPLNASEVKTRVFDNLGDNFMEAINELCKIATESSMGVGNDAFDIVTLMGNDGKSLHIIDLNTTLKLKVDTNSNDKLTVHLSSENSLLDEVTFASQISKDAAYALPRIVNTENGAAIIYSVFFEDAKLNKPTTTIGKLIKKLGISDINAKALDTTQLKETWRQKLQQATEGVYKDQIFREIIENQATPIGLALRAYFTSLTLTIHGTAMIPFTTYVDFRGFIQGADGIYWVLGSQDILSPNEFKTVLTCTLQEPYT